ncbi:histidine ammonia-lyase [Providencia huaxiensis]|uniref:Histidine ammonia-lyase n=1 Tax=Providencia huaxiensis TaxID=2027290 RepID=A0ABU2IXK6_9GAMM|nr:MULTISPECIES: histidine ammonia-lyase [Providencia]MBZ3680222.1 histidine ammonia-lyase [Providencia rettgeri]AXH60970.1 histidine ammonia-lyase [Providencia huaxiensis]MDT0133280.1 histidine ammonia-lyase [Providencia huaxiensis]MDT1979686.1 histidine ammonia-lyase [Providencia huaxiensis]QLR02699.1 histidine ammonia-lyase [Providencia rettgeri]
MTKLTIHPGKMTLEDLRIVFQQAVTVTLDKRAHAAIEKSVATVNKIIEEDRTAYGINTGFGLLANTRIATKDLQSLQRSIVMSHAAGVGEPLDDDLVRLIMVLKINSLARGFSGIRLEVINALIALVNAQVYPFIPAKGSVGASGDLAPLAHMSLILLGEGKARYEGKWISAKKALEKAGLVPLKLEAKEGLALLNGTQTSTAFALKGLFEAEKLLLSGIVCGALSVEATLGSRKPFDARVQEVRGQKGQIDVAAMFRDILSPTSELAKSHENCVKVQDPYSLRCQPQVMGACLTQIRQAAEVILIESNAVSDNPLVFTDNGDIISGGNFHAEPVAMAADNIALALAEIGALSERRIALLMDTHMSQLPPFLVNNGGVNSGFMIAQVTAAALASENKALAHPSSVDSLPTSANQEDHVSMAPAAGRRLWEMAKNVTGILAIEWLSACQGMDFREGLTSSETLEKARKTLRDQVTYYDKDRYFAPDIEAAIDLINQYKLSALFKAGAVFPN